MPYLSHLQALQQGAGHIGQTAPWQIGYNTASVLNNSGGIAGWNPSLYGFNLGDNIVYGIGGGPAGQQYLANQAAQSQYQQQSANTYRTELANAQRDYSNLVNSYQRQLGLIDASNQSIQSAYTQLLNQLIGGVAGTEGPARQAIYDDYLRNLGRQGQDLVSRGLTNTTVKDSVERGVLSDKWRRDNELSASMAQLVANYESQIGLAGLGAQREAQQQRNALEFQYAQLRQQAEQYQRGLEQQYRLAMLGGGGGGRGGGGGGGGGGRQQLPELNRNANPAFGALIPEGGYANNFGFGGGGYYGPAPNYGQTLDLWGGGNFSDASGTYFGGLGPFPEPVDYFGNTGWNF